MQQQATSIVGIVQIEGERPAYVEMVTRRPDPPREPERISWTVLGEPIGQGRPRACVIGGHARLYTPKKSASWCAQAVEAFACHWDGAPYDGAVRVTVDAVFSRPQRLLRRKDPDGRIAHASKPDADNVAKAVLDAMTKAGVLRDDALVTELLVRKWYAAREEGPRVEVSLEPMQEPKERELVPSEQQCFGCHDVHCTCGVG